MFDFCSSTSASVRAVLAGDLDALVVVVDGDRERPLGGLLADHVLVQDLVDLLRLRQVLELEASAATVSSSSMISLQRSMHSSQM